MRSLMSYFHTSEKRRMQKAGFYGKRPRVAANVKSGAGSACFRRQFTRAGHNAGHFCVNSAAAMANAKLINVPMSTYSAMRWSSLVSLKRRIDFAATKQVLLSETHKRRGGEPEYWQEEPFHQE